MSASRRFPPGERALLLAVRGVGPRVVERLEEAGLHALPDLARKDPEGLARRIAGRLVTTCWRNSPAARAALAGAVEAARSAAPRPGGETGRPRPR